MQRMMQQLRAQMGTGGQQQNAPILGRMLFGDGGLPGMMNKIPTPFGGNGLFGGLFGGGAGASSGAGAPMMLPGGPGAAAMGASSAAPALASAAPAAAAGGSGGLMSALSSLFALI